MREIFVYSSMQAWIDQMPDTSLRGIVISSGNGYIQVQDENGYTQIINLDKLFAVVY